MTEKEIQEIYKQLNIEEKPLTMDYNPDEYARNLLKNIELKDEISYSANTTLYAQN